MPEAANSRVSTSPRVRLGAGHEHIDANPARDIAYVRNATEGHHTWTLEDVEKYEARHPIGTKARLAMDLLLMTVYGAPMWCCWGASMCVMAGSSSRCRRARRKPMTLELPMLPALQKAIEAGPTGP